MSTIFHPNTHGEARGGRPCPKAAQPWVLAAMILGSSMVFIDGTVVNVALPALQTSLNADVAGVQWVIEAYSLLLSALLLVGGSAGDIYGRRRVYVIGVTLFALASAWCGFASSIEQLIVARAWQGIGGALLVPGSLAIISSSFTERERARAIGAWSGFSAITTAIGPVVGGWLVEHISWRAVFFLNLPLATIVIILCYRHVPESSSPGKTRLDWAGALLATLGLGALIYGLLDSSLLGLTNPRVVSSLVISVVLLVAFLFFQACSSNPMLPLDIFRSRDFTGANLLTFLLYSALGGMLFLLPLNLIQAQHYSPTAAGAALLPMILIIFLLSRWSGGLMLRFGAKIPLVIGPLTAATGFALFAWPRIGGSYWTTFFPAAVVLGVGMGISVAPLTTVVMNSVPAERVGLASGINNAVSRTGGLLAIAVLGIVVLHSFSHALDHKVSDLHLVSAVRAQLRIESIKLGNAKPPSYLDDAIRQRISRAIAESFVHGFRVAAALCSVLALAGAGTSLILLSRASARSR
jgi:EmrB/QacA subfamily drug resistance transporter